MTRERSCIGRVAACSSLFVFKIAAEGGGLCVLVHCRAAALAELRLRNRWALAGQRVGNKRAVAQKQKGVGWAEAQKHKGIGQAEAQKQKGIDQAET